MAAPSVTTAAAAAVGGDGRAAGTALQVAHAGGVFRGLTYTSSPEAIAWNYACGFRWFEVDIVRLGGDGSIITAHDGQEPAYGLAAVGDFATAHLADLRDVRTEGVSWCTLPRLLHLLQRLPGAHFILDVKGDRPEVYAALAAEATAAGVLDRVVPQAYNPTCCDDLRRLRFPRWLLTMWGMFGALDTAGMVALVAAQRPRIVWLWSQWWTPDLDAEFRRLGVQHVGVHGGMTRDKCCGFLREGVCVMNDCAFIEDPRIATPALVEAAYRAVLHREVDASGRAEYTLAIEHGKLPTEHALHVKLQASAECKRRRLREAAPAAAAAGAAPVATAAEPAAGSTRH